MRLVESNRPEILEIVRRHRGRSVSVFGSVARGDERTDSDIDFLPNQPTRQTPTRPVRPGPELSL